jgi:hypothetical protein
VTQIFDTGGRFGLMCQLQFQCCSGEESPIFVASIMRLSFDRRSPIGREIAAYQRSRREAASASAAMSPPAAGPLRVAS